MTIKELIEKLQNFDETDVVLAFDGLYHSPVMGVEQGSNPFLVNLILGDDE